MDVDLVDDGLPSRRDRDDDNDVDDSSRQSTLRCVVIATRMRTVAESTGRRLMVLIMITTTFPR